MNAQKLMQELIKYAPMALLFAMLATFGIAGYFEAVRTTEHGLIVAVSIATTIQVIRIASGLSSSNFFAKREYLKATLVLAFSLAITIFEFRMVAEPEVQLLIWAGLFLEFFLGISMTSGKANVGVTYESGK